MAKPGADAPNYVRRRDRNIEDERWIIDFLHRAPVGMLATVYEGQPFMHSNLYVYDEEQDCIFMHTAKAGRTRTNAEQTEARACFSIMEMGRLLPADEALEFSVEYAGVTVFGSVRVVEGEADAERGLDLLMRKYAPHMQPSVDYRPANADDLKRTSVYRLDIDSWSGKMKPPQGDFPGAYWYQSEKLFQSQG